jgi:hypothetical protein
MVFTMDKKALQLASRFSLPPNSLGYCGRGSATEKFKACFIKGDCADVGLEIEKFIVLHPYLKTISQITNLPKFSYQVVECFWLGNKLINQAKVSDYDNLLENFLEQGVPSWLVEELKEKRPKRFLPFHLFQVLHVGVGRASGSVPFNMEAVNNCMIRWGEVLKIGREDLTVKINSLKKTKDHYKLVQKEENFSYHPDFLKGIKPGDTLAVHWQQPIKILTEKEKENLTYWTKETLESLL